MAAGACIDVIGVWVQGKPGGLGVGGGGTSCPAFLTRCMMKLAAWRAMAAHGSATKCLKNSSVKELYEAWRMDRGSETGWGGCVRHVRGERAQGKR